MQELDRLNNKLNWNLSHSSWTPRDTATSSGATNKCRKLLDSTSVYRSLTTAFTAIDRFEGNSTIWMVAENYPCWIIWLISKIVTKWGHCDMFAKPLGGTIYLFDRIYRTWSDSADISALMISAGFPDVFSETHMWTELHEGKHAAIGI